MSKIPNSLIGVDLGGTKIAAGILTDGTLINKTEAKINQDSEDPMDAVRLMVGLIGELIDDKVKGIGVGVPGLVNRDWGIVYDVLNIPNWKEIPLKALIEEKFDVPVYVDNDANCFAIGEYRYGAYAGNKDFVGITLGTGMGSGIIKNGALIPDAHCCSGEFGTMSYLDGIYENYTSGMYFKLKYGKNGEEVAMKARTEEPWALKAYREMGMHLGNAIKTIIMAVDPPLIIIGGSVAKAREYYQDTMWESIRKIPFPSVLDSFRIEFSETEHIAIKGAAALCPAPSL
ncbi:MAG: ROK family protein [Bacteroidales bacterium]|nr:ROK family protein [Bacteroidales bacterium]